MMQGAPAKERPLKGKKRPSKQGQRPANKQGQRNNGQRPLTEKQLKEKERRKKENEKLRAKKAKLAKKRARKKKKRHKQSKFDKQMGNKVSDPRLDRLATTPDIWEKLAENDLYDMLRMMGNSDRAIAKYQKNRTMQALMIGIILIAIGYFMGQNMLMAGGLGAMFVIYKMKYSSVKKMYGQWRFERELAFSRFIRILIPYLKQSGGAISLYTVFNKMLDRMTDQADRDSLYMLMGEMTSRPGDLQPFNDFAERNSGSDMAYLIMSTVYDFQQSTQDTSVINELGQMASKHMMDAIDEIIAMKIKRFGMFPTKIVLSSFILVVGFAAGVLLENVMNLMSETGGIDGLF